METTAAVMRALLDKAAKLTGTLARCPRSGAEATKLAYGRGVIALLRGVKRVEAKAEGDSDRFREKLADHAEANAIGRGTWWLIFRTRGYMFGAVLAAKTRPVLAAKTRTVIEPARARRAAGFVLFDTHNPLLSLVKSFLMTCLNLRDGSLSRFARCSTKLFGADGWNVPAGAGERVLQSSID